MLGEGQGLQCPIEGTSGPGDLALIHEELAVVQPYPGHLGWGMVGLKRSVFS